MSTSEELGPVSGGGVQKRKFLIVIPARGGSKGLPGKNIKLLKNKPLIAYTIDAAKKVNKDSDICVSTDDLQIKKVVEDYGLSLPFLRPQDLSYDTSTSEEVILHALEFYENQRIFYEYVILLQPTSPLRTENHIKQAVNILTDKTELLVSVKETDSNPYYVLFEENSAGHLIKSKAGNFSRRQDCPKVYELNGAIYIINVELLKKKGLKNLTMEKYMMDKKTSIDIDDLLDFQWCEFLLNNCENNH